MAQNWNELGLIISLLANEERSERFTKGESMIVLFTHAAFLRNINSVSSTTTFFLVAKELDFSALN